MATVQTYLHLEKQDLRTTKAARITVRQGVDYDSLQIVVGTAGFHIFVDDLDDFLAAVAAAGAKPDVPVPFPPELEPVQ